MSALTVSDIFTRVQRLFGDESAVQVTEADCIRWINDAQREVVMQHEGLLAKEGTLSSVAGTAEYTLPTDLFTLTHVSYKQPGSGSFYPLRFMPVAAMNAYAGGWDGTDFPNGVPQIYTKDENTKIILYPRPDATGTNNIKLVYSRYPTDLTSSASPIDLPDYYHGYVEHFCLMKAYEMDEDWESAEKKAQVLQSTIDFNNGREAWFGRETYPAVQPNLEDYW